MFANRRDNHATKTDEKTREALSAYLDNALTPGERDRLEAQLSRDPQLRNELEQMQALKLQLRSMPRRRVPRSFALNPETVGRPKTQPLLQLYPVLRGATALAALFLIFTLALDLFRAGPLAPTAMPAAGVMMSSEAAEQAVTTAEEVPPEAGTQRERPSGELPKAETALAEPQAVPEGGTALELSQLDGDVEVLPSLETAAMPETELQSMATAVAGDEMTAAMPEVVTPASEVALVPQEDESLPTATVAGISTLRPIQIGLALAFVILLVLFLLARRQANRL